MKKIGKFFLVFVLLFSVINFTPAFTDEADAASSNSCKNEAIAISKQLNKLNNQSFKSLKAAVKSLGVIKGTKVYVAQVKELMNLKKQSEKLLNQSLKGANCAVGSTQVKW